VCDADDIIGIVAFAAAAVVANIVIRTHVDALFVVVCRRNHARDE
jgi:hypothetical protein